MTSARGVTLIELLIVMSVIAILASMAMPIVTIASRAAKQSATRAVMHKVDIAVRLFRGEVGTFPWLAHDADTAAGEHPGNDLYRRLGRRIPVDHARRVRDDAALAALQYAYDCSNGTGGPVEKPPVSAHAYRSSDIRPSRSSSGGGETVWFHHEGIWKTTMPSATERMATCVMLNRMATERARLEIFAGNPWMMGTTIQAAYRPDGVLYLPGRDNSAVRVIADGAMRSGAAPGWCHDYLKGELEQRFIVGDTIVDAWRRPLIYIGQMKEGMESTRGFIFHSTLLWIDSTSYGLAKQGRRSLAKVDPLTSAPLAADPPHLVDPSQPWRSDRRYYAAPGFEHSFELWSSGPDGRFDWMRDHSGNADNVGHQPYDRDIPR